MVFKLNQAVVIVTTVDVSKGRMDMFLNKGTRATVIKYMCKSLVSIKVEGLDEEIIVYESDIESAK